MHLKPISRDLRRYVPDLCYLCRQEHTYDRTGELIFLFSSRYLYSRRGSRKSRSRSRSPVRKRHDSRERTSERPSDRPSGERRRSRSRDRKGRF